MSVKQKILNAIATHPKLVTLGIGLAITMAIGIAVGTVETQQAHASVPAGALAATVLHGAFSSAGGGGCSNCG
jgi:hypothetical protein